MIPIFFFTDSMLGKMFYLILFWMCTLLNSCFLENKTEAGCFNVLPYFFAGWIFFALSLYFC